MKQTVKQKQELAKAKKIRDAEIATLKLSSQIKSDVEPTFVKSFIQSLKTLFKKEDTNQQ